MRYGSSVAARQTPKDVNISLRLDSQMREDAERMAVEDGMTIAAWVRHLIRRERIRRGVTRVEVRP
jgi:hypothetical protein